MELRAILVSAITIYCGLYYLNVELNKYVSLLLFLFILISNIYFLLYWLKYFLKNFPVLLKEKLPKLFKDKVDHEFDNFEDIIEAKVGIGIYKDNDLTICTMIPQ